MTLKRIINWKEVYNKNHDKWSPFQYQYWRKLSKKFNNVPIDVWNLIGYLLFDDHYDNQSSAIVNIVLTDFDEDLSLPVTDYNITVAPNYTIPIIIKAMQQSASCHTAYAYGCLRLCMLFMGHKIGDWTGSKIGDYQDGILLGHVLPNWMKIILDRQKQLALNSGLDADGPLLFINRWDGFEKRYLNTRSIRASDEEISKLNYRLSLQLNVTIAECSFIYKKFCGLKPGAILQESTGKTYYKKPQYAIVLHSLVGILHYVDNHKQMYDFGYLLGEVERGIYLINGTRGTYYAPYYLITQPVIRRDRIKDNYFKDNLYKLGYKDKEFYKSISTHRELISHKIEPKRITYEATLFKS